MKARADEAQLAAWIRDAARGDVIARNRLAEELLPVIITMCRSRLGPTERHHLDDMISAVSVWVVEGLPAHCQAFDANAGRPFHWVWRLVRSSVSRYFRDLNAQKRQREVLTDEPPETRDGVDHGEQAALSLDIARAVCEFEGELANPQRAVFLLKLIERRASKEVAAELGLSLANVDKIASRLRRQLMDWLRARGLDALVMVLFMIAATVWR